MMVKDTFDLLLYSETGMVWGIVSTDGKEMFRASLPILPNAELQISCGQEKFHSAFDSSLTIVPSLSRAIIDNEGMTAATLTLETTGFSLTSGTTQILIETNGSNYVGQIHGEKVLTGGLNTTLTPPAEFAYAFERAYSVHFYRQFPKYVQMCATLFPMLRFC